MLLYNRYECVADHLNGGVIGFLLVQFDTFDMAEKPFIFNVLSIGQRQMFGAQSWNIILGCELTRFTEALKEAIARSMNASAARHTFVARQLLRLLLVQNKRRNA